MNDNLRLLRKDNTGTRFYECPFCSADIKVLPSTFTGMCPACKCSIIDYKPAVYQEKFHQSKAQYKLNIGGFGSGKTTMCCAELAVHALSIPNGRSLITGPKLQLIRDAVIPEFEKMLPPHLIERKQKSPNIYYKLKNGHEILVYASNDDENLRSLNLTAFYIEEASNVDYEVFRELQNRLRNTAALVYNDRGEEIDDHYLGLVSSNPDEGWVRDNFLLIAGKLFTSESIDRTMYDKVRGSDVSQHYHAFISSTRDNPYLPKVFIERLVVGKTPAWIRKYIDCYLDIREGAVYPEFPMAFVQPRPIPKNWLRLAGFDKGYRDETAMLVAAIDPSTGIIYVHTEYYEAERPISYHGLKIAEMMRGLPLYNNIQGDPSIRNRNERDGETYQSYFLKVSGIYIQPGNNDIATGIEKVRDYMFLGKLKFFDTLENLKKEAVRYVYKDDQDVPIDKNNHLMDALRYMIAPLPQNPMEFTGEMIKQSQLTRDFWGGDWVTDDTDESIVSAGNVYMLKGGFTNHGRLDE
jgi:PBSX family phage terminase large subunit